MAIRPPALAGRFYPGPADALRAQIAGFLSAAEPPPGNAGAPKAIIAPHAGTIYSGPIAATAYRRLGAAEGVERIVILGPAHRVPLVGIAAPSADAFATPLGEVTIDRATVDELLTNGLVVEDDEAHRLEHSLEIHLPFIQLTFPDAEIVPLVVGATATEDVKAVIDTCWRGPETRFVVSTDLSHFHSYEVGQALDRETSSLIEELRFEALNGDRACGAFPLRGMLLAARERQLSVATVDLRSSGDTAGAHDRVVGYGAYVVC